MRPPGTYPCCYGEDGRLTANVVLAVGHPLDDPKHGIRLYICRVCGRKHSVMDIAPIDLHARIPLG